MRDDNYNDGGGRSHEDRGGKKEFKKKKRTSFRKRRPPVDLKFDYKKVQDLMPFLTEEGKIIPARVSGLRASQQRQLTLAVKRARNIGFISPIRRQSISE